MCIYIYIYKTDAIIILVFVINGKVNVAITSGGVQHEMMKVSKHQQISHKLTSLSSGPWMEDGAILKPCRPKPSLGKFSIESFSLFQLS